MTRQVAYDIDKIGYAFRRYRRTLAAVFVLSFTINLLMLSTPLHMLRVYDRVLTSRNAETLVYLTPVIGVAFVSMWLLDILRSRLMVTVLAAPVRSGFAR